MLKVMNKFDVTPRKVNINSFVLVSCFGGYKCSVVAECGGITKWFEDFGTTPNESIRDVEFAISLHFDTYFEFSTPHHIDFSLN